MWIFNQGVAINAAVITISEESPAKMKYVLKANSVIVARYQTRERADVELTSIMVAIEQNETFYYIKNEQE